MVTLPLIAWTMKCSRDVLHVILLGCVIGLPLCFIKGQNMDQQSCSDPPLPAPSLSSPSLASSLGLIYPASRPWGGTALGRLLTQEKRAFNVMSLCRKAWQSRGLGHLLQEINTSPSSFSECNGLDITSPVGHYGLWIINPSCGVGSSVCVCAHVSKWAQTLYVSAYVCSQ